MWRLVQYTLEEPEQNCNKHKFTTVMLLSCYSVMHPACMHDAIENAALNAAENWHVGIFLLPWMQPQCNQCIPACRLHAGMHFTFLLPRMQPNECAHVILWNRSHYRSHAGHMRPACRPSVTAALEAEFQEDNWKPTCLPVVSVSLTVR